MNLPCTNLRERSRQRGGRDFAHHSLRPLPHEMRVAIRRRLRDVPVPQLRVERDYGHSVNVWPIRPPIPSAHPVLRCLPRHCDTQTNSRCAPRRRVRHGRRHRHEDHHYGQFVNIWPMCPRVQVAQWNLGDLRWKRMPRHCDTQTDLSYVPRRRDRHGRRHRHEKHRYGQVVNIWPIRP